MNTNSSAVDSSLVKERKIGSFNVDSVTNAPLQIEVSLKLNISQEAAFKLVFNDLESWFKEIQGVKWDNSNSTDGLDKPGLNSFRACGFGGKKLYENIVFYEYPNAYGYVVDMKKSTASFPVKDPLGVFLVESKGSNECILTWRQYFNKKLHPAALIINFMVKNVLMKKNLKTLINKYGGGFV